MDSGKTWSANPIVFGILFRALTRFLPMPACASLPPCEDCIAPFRLLTVALTNGPVHRVPLCDSYDIHRQWMPAVNAGSVSPSGRKASTHHCAWCSRSRASRALRTAASTSSATLGGSLRHGPARKSQPWTISTASAAIAPLICVMSRRSRKKCRFALVRARVAGMTRKQSHARSPWHSAPQST